jgi:hypothetical protein
MHQRDDEHHAEEGQRVGKDGRHPRHRGDPVLD